MIDATKYQNFKKMIWDFNSTWNESMSSVRYYYYRSNGEYPISYLFTFRRMDIKSVRRQRVFSVHSILVLSVRLLYYLLSIFGYLWRLPCPAILDIKTANAADSNGVAASVLVHVVRHQSNSQSNGRMHSYKCPICWSKWRNKSRYRFHAQFMIRDMICTCRTAFHTKHNPITFPTIFN